MHPPNTVYSHLSMAIKCTVRHMHREARCEENLLTASSSAGLPLPDIWRPDVSANNLANVQLNLGRTMGILTHSSILFIFFSLFSIRVRLYACSCCLPVVCQNLLHVDTADGLEGSARSFPLMVISSRHIRENVIMPSVVYLMVIKYVPEYSGRGSSCILMSLDMKEGLEIIRVMIFK